LKLLNPYISYIKSIKPDICEKIIDLGLSKMVMEKSKSASTIATTLNEKQKKNIELERNKASGNLSMSDKTLEEIQSEEKDLDKYYMRDSEISWLTDKWLYDTFLPLIGDANKKAGWNWKIDAAETFQFTVYHGRKENGGFYGWHSDGSSDFNGAYKPAIKINKNPPRFKPVKKIENIISKNKNGEPEPDLSADDLPLKKDGLTLNPKFSEDKNKWGKVRKISMTLNLTESSNYEGGNLKFDLGPHVKENRFKVCDEIRPKGSVIIFPSFMYHCVTPVTSGTRYSLVLWCLGKPWQ
jgi:PKHD-type hydroxylase